eukprot:Plantae.Rhodophyta-Purpureofilum_apyrenoidigerum.ctg2496.p1 GENE.Plantae.Rhodophyta-Purpureofilum_apyrenoidigerum.ctg2496~~Plantae.Rhodophyta-Purpureofilum_apyrenoidigerum.ctg2496.p1  ORF type:complete len:505 (-),score=122.14 Plantae.Rhodophyta-Purpureofilum_apyrenoidigerum.ctg2496:1692-3206(-)
MPDDLAKAVLLRNTMEKEKRMLWPTKKNEANTTKRKSVEKAVTTGAKPPLNPIPNRKSPSRDDSDAEKNSENTNNQDKSPVKSAQRNSKGDGEPSPTAREPSMFAAETEEEVLARSVVPASEHFPVAEEFVGPQHFHKLKLLGRGGIGKVYLVLLKNTNKLYAMKTLTKEEMIARNKVKRVMTEREILATANHPFIVTMYASFQTSERLCFVMEFCEGGEFFRVLQKQPKKRLKEDAGRFYSAEVTLALEYLHHIGFIYRDLKPENILMRANGHVALTDFDLSKQAHAVSPKIIQQQQKMIDRLKGSFAIKRSGSKINELKIVDSEPVLPYQTNSFVGTEEYIAPEVVNGTGQTSAVDWWTLGILIYEMLTGTTPFKGSYADETFSNIMNNEIKWPTDVDVGPDAKNLVKKLLRREADKRLGHENGASDIKTHKWFSKINFTLIRNLDAPIMPKIRDPYDLSQYGPLKDDNDEADTVVHDKDNTEDPFQNFTLRRDSETLNRQY